MKNALKTLSVCFMACTASLLVNFSASAANEGKIYRCGNEYTSAVTEAQLKTCKLISGRDPTPNPETLELVANCKIAVNLEGKLELSRSEALGMGYCWGMMEGLKGGNAFLKKSDPKVAFCEPAGIDNGDLAVAFLKGVSSFPFLLELRGVMAAQVALTKEFPCKPAKNLR
jgi:hypothetical protein